jgi:hypothetical protein
MIQKGDTGAIVKALQESLISLGYPLPRWGADGWWGGESETALKSWADPRNVDVFPIIPDAVIEQVMAEDRTIQKRLVDYHIFDIRRETDPSVVHGRNPIDRIDTICLHQMACKDSSDLGWKRWRSLPVHWLITEGENSRAYLLHDFNAVTWHGHGWNYRSVGLEIEGYFSGIGTDPKYFWSPEGYDWNPMTPTEQQLEAAKNAIRMSVAAVEAAGGRIKYIAAHRQSAPHTRTSDPGELLWRGVALPMMEELGLEQAPTLRGGEPIPEAWDEERNPGVSYYTKG